MPSEMTGAWPLPDVALTEGDGAARSVLTVLEDTDGLITEPASFFDII